jgi:hypothetical protein
MLLDLKDKDQKFTRICDGYQIDPYYSNVL